jgi:hypothetical protein
LKKNFLKLFSYTKPLLSESAVNVVSLISDGVVCFGGKTLPFRFARSRFDEISFGRYLQTNLIRVKYKLINVDSMYVVMAFE